MVQAAAAAVGRLMQGGYDTIYDGVVRPWFLPTFARVTGLRNLDYVMLVSPTKVCLEQVLPRHSHGLADQSATRHMHRDFTQAVIDHELEVIPSPADVERALWEIPAGQTKTQPELRRALARQHNADNACPAMTGFQLRFVAEVAVEALEAGAAPGEVAPFWRVVDPAGKIAGRLPNGGPLIAQLRESDPAST